MPDTQPDLIRIGDDALSATISPVGAELQTLTTAAGQDLLWSGDARWWSGRAPILFPIVGALAGDRHPVGTEQFTLPKHGFARRARFTPVDTGPAAVTLRLEASDATLAVYPYRFRLDIRFAINDGALSTVAQVSNPDGQPIPVSFGYHPAFLWPVPGAGARQDQAVTFALDEPSPASRITPAGLLRGPEPVNRVVDRQLRLEDALFDEDALLYLAPRSRSVRFGAADGTGAALEVAFPDLPHLGIWTKPGGAPFLCIEPWSGYASPDGFTGPLMDKPGTQILAPGETRAYTMIIRYLPG